MSLDALREIEDKSSFSNSAGLYAEEDTWEGSDGVKFFSDNFVS